MSNAFSVLLVDDDENTQSFFQDALEHNGIQLTVASDLSSTMKILSDQHQRPDIIVLDIFLPDTDGYKLLGQIRALQQGHTCPIIAIT